MFGELDQLVLAEEHPVLVAGLGDPVGVDEQAVTGFELLLRRLLPALRSGDAEGGAVRALEPLDDVPAPDQQRGHVPGVEVREGARDGVEAREEGGGELAGSRLRVDERVGVRRDRGEVLLAGTPCVADPGDRERCGDAGSQVVARGVVHGEVDDVALDVVVEGVARDVALRFEGRRHHDALGGDRAGWQQLPQQLAGRGQRPVAAPAPQLVAVDGLAAEDVTHEARHRQEPSPQPGVVAGGAVTVLGEPDAHHAEAVGPVEHRHPQERAAVRVRIGQDLAELVGLPADRGGQVDPVRRPGAEGGQDALRGVGDQRSRRSARAGARRRRATWTGLRRWPGARLG